MTRRGRGGIFGVQSSEVTTSGIFDLQDVYASRLDNVWPTGNPVLWRLYVDTLSTYLNLWDIEPDSTTGIFDSSNTRITDGMTYNSTTTATSGTYGIYESSSANPFSAIPKSTSFDAGPGNMLSSNSTSDRTSWIGSAGQWIYIYFSDGISLLDMSGATIGLRTYQAGRPDRCPQVILFQYYTGPLISEQYDENKWSTYATLTNTAQTFGNPRYRNITEGSTIVASN